MNVIAAKCEACSGRGFIVGTKVTNTRYGDVHEGVFTPCFICNATGLETPPQQHAAIPNERKSDE